MPTPVRGALAGLPSYEFAAQDVPGVERVVQLGQNELGVAPSPHAIEAAARATGDLNRYPEPGHGRLRRAIAGVHGLSPEKVVCGAGSIELMGLLATAYCEPGVEVVVSRFGYKYFELQCAAAGAVREVTRLRGELRTHVRELGLEAGPSHANFVLVRFPGDGPVGAEQAFERLKNAGIIVRPTGSHGLSDCLRVTIGSAEEMAAVSGELVRIIGERSTATARMQPGARTPT